MRAAFLGPLNSFHLSVLIIPVMKEKESIYQVFGTLQEFIKDHRIRLTEERRRIPQEKHPRQEQSQQDDGEAFLEAMKDVKKVNRSNERMREMPKDAKGLALPEKESDRTTMDEILKETYTFNVINLPEYMEGYVDDVNPLIMEKLRRGEFSVQKVLDLHGLSARDAYDAFHEFAGQAVQTGLRCVKIIHGRDRKSVV